MAVKGMTVFTQNGEDFTINDQNIAPEFSTGSAYVIGDCVTYQGDLYTFQKNHSAGTWNADHVRQISLADEVDKRAMVAKNGSNIYEKTVSGETVIDYNDIIVPGVYIMNTATTKLNAPNSEGYNCVEVYAYGQTGFFRQITFNITYSNWKSINNSKFERYFNGSEWTPWIKFISVTDQEKFFMKAKDAELHTEGSTEYYDLNDYLYTGLFIMDTETEKQNAPDGYFNALEVYSYNVSGTRFVKQVLFNITDAGNQDRSIKSLQNTVYVRYHNYYGWTDWIKEVSRKDIDPIEWSIKKYNAYDLTYFYKPTEGEYENKGITFTWNEDRTCTMSGTQDVDGVARYEMYRGALPEDFTPGESLYVKMNSLSGKATLRIYFYDAQWSDVTRVVYFISADQAITVPSIAANLIIWLGIEANQGATINETVNPAILTRASGTGSGGGNVTNYNTFNYTVHNDSYTVNASPQIESTSDLYLASTGDTTDRTADIMALLQTQKVCKLGVGDFYIKTGISMPDGTSIIGCGRATRLILDPSVTEGFVISVGSYCSVQDLRMTGSLTDLPYEEYEIGGRDGIVELGDQTGFDGQGTFANNFDKLSNLWIENFNGSGIRAYRNDGAASFLATNIDIFRCGVGVNIEMFSEFHAWTNIRCRWCVYACIMNGGNNLFSNCHWDVCIHLLKIDNSLGNLVNDTHSSFTNCTFCHADSNNGDAMEIIGVQNGLVFSNCQIFYSKIRMTDTKGVVLANFNFGNAENIILTNCRGINISNCIFGSNPVIQYEGSTGIIFTNNMTRAGVPITLN